jgi:hypothetical protein
VFLTTAPQDFYPSQADFFSESSNGRSISGHTIIPDVTADNRSQIRTLLWDRVMHAMLKLGIEEPIGTLFLTLQNIRQKEIIL